MNLKDKIAIVTGAASGIGKALCERFHAEGAAGVAAVDINKAGARETAASIGGLLFGADVSDEADIIRVVEETENHYGQIDVFASNAGILTRDNTHAASATNEEWERIWGINTMAHIYAARAVLPKMIERGSGYLLNTASAAGLLNQIDHTPYAVTKHAAVAFAESLAIAHYDQGIRVSVLCPQAVRTGMTGDSDGGSAGFDGMLEPNAVCDAVIEAMEEETFLVLPHPEVLTYMQRKTSDYDRWLKGMRRFRDRIRAGKVEV
ncbi:MAG: short-chain dehydrogenase [Opitutaceae bacterium]|nr:short-chain dehydrogenase [Opitutaceae bacterium]|tara:strand:- start:2640 stop:3428 length:789 start_codon:yes stop_codon:yes gene_type:complete